MKRNVRTIIFAVVLLAVGAIFAIPYLNTDAVSPGKKLQKFTVTEHPVNQVNEAVKNGKPVYLEFYGGT